MPNKIVTFIEPTKTKTSKPLSVFPSAKRVCAYARVSTDLEEQQSSYDKQIEYYTNYIKDHPNWEFVGVYADEGITGTNNKYRAGFNSMIEDAKANKIDLILTKSISRFARNTVLSIETVRELKELGVGVYFEKENIDTLDPKSEMVLTIFSSLAQEESRSISENVRWGLDKRAKDGKVSMPYKHFLGYKKGRDGTPEIDEDEAKIVRLIYDMYLEGNSTNKIAEYLTSKNIPTPGGKSKWYQGCIKSILTNEKYKGDAIINKTFTTDFITKTVKVNTGEVPKYYVQNSHPAIIDPKTFDLVQTMINNPDNKKSQLQGINPFSHKIICADCGEYFGHKTWSSRDRHKYSMWVCNHKSQTTKDDKNRCKTPNLREDLLKDAYLSAMRGLLATQGELKAKYADIIRSYNSPNRITRHINEGNKIKQSIIEKKDTLDQLTALPYSKIESVKEYQAHKDELISEITELENRLNTQEKKEQELSAKVEQIQRFEKALDKFAKQPAFFNDKIFIDTVETIEVSKDKLTINFKDGSMTTISI